MNQFHVKELAVVMQTCIALQWLRQKNHELEVGLGYTVRPWLEQTFFHVKEHENTEFCAQETLIQYAKQIPRRESVGRFFLLLPAPASFSYFQI
jgi:hypothetical protein